MESTTDLAISMGLVSELKSPDEVDGEDDEDALNEQHTTKSDFSSVCLSTITLLSWRSGMRHFEAFCDAKRKR